MKIKRFFASEMRDAIRQVKEELGADAVILSNNKVDGGIELVAAIDYDEDAVHRSLDTQTSARMEYKKKRSVVAKVRKPENHNPLEDAIKDDVISFSHHKVRSTPGEQLQNNHSKNAAQQVSSSQDSEVQAGGFAEIFKKSGGVNSKNNLSKEENLYSRPSLKERKQPYISELNEFSDKVEDPQLSPAESYPFDYESLAYEAQLRAEQSEIEKHDRHEKVTDDEDFFSQTSTYGTQQIDEGAFKTQTRTKKVPVKDKIQWMQDPTLTSMQEEMKSLRGILENQLSGLAWGDFARRNPHHAELLSRLYRLGIKPSLSEKIVKQLKNNDSLEDSWRKTLSLIARNIPMSDTDLLDEGGMIALVGPTGVGKTTNIAKLAARYTLKYGAKNLALVTTDNYRVGAHEQLKTYGRILGVPVYVANDDDELKQILSRLNDKQLVLIDTAGMSHRDLRLAQQLSMLRHSHDNIKILAVLSAASQTLAMDEVIKAFNANELDGCIASKMDESTSMGGIISILIENQLHLNYISDGQKVPEDIHCVDTKELLKQALEMVRQHPVPIKTDELAMSYSVGGLKHAFS